MRPQVLTIAGSDSGGGAGIQADLKTFQELGVFGTSAITAVTAQNTLGVHGIESMSAELVARQIEAVATDFTISACKTGMLFDAAIIETVAASLERFSFPHVVVDPVMIAKGGASLLQDEAVTALRTTLLPLATVVTPNIPEAEVLTGMSIHSMDERLLACEKLRQYGVDIVILKGGHTTDDRATDLIVTASEAFTVSTTRHATKDTHGTGCTFSAALTAELATGVSIRQAVLRAKAYIQQAITDGLELGHGHGPTNHWAHRQPRKEDVIVEAVFEARHH